MRPRRLTGRRRGRAFHAVPTLEFLTASGHRPDGTRIRRKVDPQSAEASKNPSAQATVPAHKFQSDFLGEESALSDFLGAKTGSFPKRTTVGYQRLRRLVLCVSAHFVVGLRVAQPRGGQGRSVSGVARAERERRRTASRKTSEGCRAATLKITLAKSLRSRRPTRGPSRRKHRARARVSRAQE